MEAKHTPGPWQRDGLTVYALDERKNANRFSFHVQEGYLHHTRHEKIRTPAEELEATAILAQAAPVLLEALCLAHDYLAANGWDDDPRIEPIRAAIASAT